jgi:hypothetical protein
VTGYPRSGNSLTAAQILTATLTFAVTCGRSCVPLAVEPEISPLGPEWADTPGRTFQSASMPASGPRHVAAHCRRRFAHRSGHSRSTADARMRFPGGLATGTPVPQASCRTVPSAQADGPMPASGPRHVRGPLPSPIRPSKRPLPIHSGTRTVLPLLVWWPHHSSTPGQLPDRPVGPGRRADAGIGPTARPRPIAVADSPIEAATPDPQHPVCLPIAGTGPRDGTALTLVAHEQLLAGDHCPLRMPSLIHFRLLSSWHRHTIVKAAPGTRSATPKPEPDRTGTG